LPRPLFAFPRLEGIVPGHTDSEVMQVRAVVLPMWGAQFQNAAEEYWGELERMGVSEVVVLRPDCEADCTDFTADEPFLMLWGEPGPAQLYAAARLHRARRGAATLLLSPGTEKGEWQVSCDRQGRVNYLEESPPVLRWEETMACVGAICEPMPGLPLPESEEELLGLLRFWMDRGELWGAASEERPESRAAMGEEVTENPLYFL